MNPKRHMNVTHIALPVGGATEENIKWTVEKLAVTMTDPDEQPMDGKQREIAFKLFKATAPEMERLSFEWLKSEPEVASKILGGETVSFNHKVQKLTMAIVFGLAYGIREIELKRMAKDFPTVTSESDMDKYIKTCESGRYPFLKGIREFLEDNWEGDYNQFENLASHPPECVCLSCAAIWHVGLVTSLTKTRSEDPNTPEQEIMDAHHRANLIVFPALRAAADKEKESSDPIQDAIKEKLGMWKNFKR